MRTTFWPNRIRERQSGENCHTGLKFSSKRENSALSMKIVQNALFRSCAARFGQIAFLSVKVLKIVSHTGLKFSSKMQNSALFMKIVQNPLFRSWASNFWKSLHLSQILFKTQCAFENYQKFFLGHAQHVLAKSHFWSHWPQFSPKRENSALFMKIVQNPLFRSCAARFGQIALVSVKVVKIVTLASNSLQKGKTVRFSWKLYKTLFSDNAHHVLPKSHFSASKFSKSSHWPEILFKTGKQYAFHKNCTKRSFHVMRSMFWPNRIFEGQSCQNRQTSLKLSSKREKSALSMKIVQNALLRSCAPRFGQIAFVSVKVVKIVTLAWNSLQKGKTVRFPWNLYKTFFLGHAQHVLANRIFEGQSSENRHTRLKFSSKMKTVRFSWKLYKTLFSDHFWGSNFWKSLHLSQILFKTGKQCAFHENCTKRSF